jgi:precorrin-6A/cobalt-precorrin-6A reductase
MLHVRNLDQQADSTENSMAQFVLWVIGGTSDSILLATALAERGIPCLVTVTTAAARRGYPENERLRVRVGALETQELSGFIQQEKIGAIVDASHPFAVEISRGAMATAQSLQIPYWRYERPMIEPADGASIKYVNYRPDLEAVLTADTLKGQRVLLILGYRWLAHFRPWQEQATLFARILPSAQALAAALEAGFTPDRLIALRPPIGPELERALWRQWQITRVITKASGVAGGEATKGRVAGELGIPLVVINRPTLNYPDLYQCHDQLTAKCQQWWHSVNHCPETESIR